MLALKSAVYVLTFATALFFGFWELKIKRQLVDAALPTNENPSDLGVWNDLAKRMERERFLRSLPRERLSKYHIIVGLKFLFAALLVVEVIVLQR
jgi:hypothetical protein